MIRRNTVQRSIVLQTVGNLHNHATADEVYEAVSKAYPNISRGTVYRNLAVLAEDGDIRKIEVADGADRYDHNTEPHYHIKCVRCKNVYDYGRRIDNINSFIEGSNGFQLIDYEIVFRGICPNCQKEPDVN